MVTEKGKVYAAGSVPVPPTDPPLLRVFRDEIARHLIEEAKRLHPAAITFHFSTPVIGLDFEQQSISLADKKVRAAWPGACPSACCFAIQCKEV